MKIKTLLQQCGINLFEAEILLSHLLQVSRAYLHTYPEKTLSLEIADQFIVYAKKRKAGIPVAYLIQKKEFWSLTLKITQETLIPRPETELLVETVLEAFGTKHPYRFLELGTGSGAISIALAASRKNFHCTATDISKKALQVARENQCHYRLKNIDFKQGSWFEPVKGKFHAIISNPPYIAADDPHLQQGDLRFEPKVALVGGHNGLEAISHIIAQAEKYLLPQGIVFLEHGYDQSCDITALFCNHGYTQIKTRKDLNQRPRVTFGRLYDVKS